MPFIERNLFWAYGPLRALWHLESKVRAVLQRIEPILPVFTALSGEALYWQFVVNVAWDRRLLITLHVALGLALSLTLCFRLLRPVFRLARALMHGGLGEVNHYLHQAWHHRQSKTLSALWAAYVLFLLLLSLTGWELLLRRRGIFLPISRNWGSWPVVLHVGLRLWLYALWCWLGWKWLKGIWQRIKTNMQQP